MMAKRNRRMKSNATLWVVGLAALWLAGCSSAGQGVSDLPILNTRWYLLSFSDATGAHEVPTDPIPFLEVAGDWLSFDNGCNEIYANSQVDAERFNMEMVIMRGTGCGDRISAAAIELERTMDDAIVNWSTYTVEGDELIMPFEDGEARFSRAIPANEYDLRAFPLQQREPVKPDYLGEEVIRGRLIQEEGCLRLPIPNYYFESGFLLVWPAIYAVGFDADGVGVFNLQTTERVAGVGDEVVISGGRIDEAIDPLLDSELLLLSSFTGGCAGPYWIMGDILSLEE